MSQMYKIKLRVGFKPRDMKHKKLPIAKEIFLSYCDKPNCDCGSGLGIIILYLTDEKDKPLMLPLIPEDAFKIGRQLIEAAKKTVRCPTSTNKRLQ